MLPLSLLLFLAPQQPVGEASEAALVPYGERIDVAYGSGAQQKLDLYYPLHVAPPFRTVLFLHGGGFTGGDKAIDTSQVLFTELLRRGIAVASANYGLAPQFVYPAPIHDAGRAVQFLRYEHDALGIDPTEIALVGRSAGAVLALWLAHTKDLAQPDAHDLVLRESSRPQAVVNYSGTTDFTLLAGSVPADVFGYATMSLVPPNLKQEISARAWILSSAGPKLRTFSIYHGQVGPSPVTDPHNALFGFALHAALNQMNATNCELDWDPSPTAATPDLDVAAWLDIQLR